MKIYIFFNITFSCCFLGNVISNANRLPYEAIFNFGDSISDTGNAATHNPVMSRNSPYGSTYFKQPSERMSDGRLIIDFIAEAYGLLMLPAYLNLTKGQDIRHGVNFAYAGATALDKHYFIQKRVNIPEGASFSLSVQLDWFKKLIHSFCRNKKAKCHNYFKKSLFVVGEIGGNDINALIPYKNITQLWKMVPLIVEAIANATSKLINEGATKLVVPGNFPIGCNSAILATVNRNNKDDYDQFGCLASYNTFIKNYNRQLQKVIKILRQKNPHIKIIYFDYYCSARRLFQSPQQYGFYSSKSETLKACCGKGKAYNVDVSIFCGSAASRICSDPSKHINWDGPHFTEATYRQIAKGLVEGPFANPSLKSPLFKIA